MSQTDSPRGRPRDARLGEDLTTLCVLSRDGATTTVAGLGRLLGVDERRAREVLRNLSSTDVSEDGDVVGPLVALYELEGEGGVGCVAAGVRGLPALRLTRSQAVATSDALDLLGLPRTGEFMLRIRQAFYPLDDPGATSSDGPRGRESQVIAGERDGFPNALLACARSLARGRGTSDRRFVSQPVVTFSYRGENDRMTRSRRIVPRVLHRRDETWLVEAYDLDARAARTFSVERMEDALTTRERADAPFALAERAEGGMVRLVCSADAAARVASWPGARTLEGLEGDRTVIDVPYYRGDWLPRHVLGLGRGVTHDNASLSREMRLIAQDDLRLAKDLGV